MLSHSHHVSPRRLTSSTFALSVIVAIILANRGWCALDVTWTSPQTGDIYEPGASILGEWQTGAEIASPSFKLCIADELGAGEDEQNEGPGDSCGSAVHLDVQQDAGTGSWQIALYVAYLRLQLT